MEKPCNSLAGGGCQANGRRLKVCIVVVSEIKLWGEGEAMQQPGQQRVPGHWEKPESMYLSAQLGF